MNTAKINIALNFEQIVSLISQLPNIEKIRLRQYLLRETNENVEILKDIKQGFSEARQHENDDLELKTLEELLDEL